MYSKPKEINITETKEIVSRFVQVEVKFAKTKTNRKLGGSNRTKSRRALQKIFSASAENHLMAPSLFKHLQMLERDVQIHCSFSTGSSSY